MRVSRRFASGLDMSNAALVNATLWNHAQVQAGFWADPWADGGPTEADLIERIVGAATPRVGGVNSSATSPASLAVLRRQYRVDVCLHHRGREPVAPASALVILLQIALPANPAVWGTQPLIVLPAAGPPLNALHAALDAIPAGGGPLPGQLVLPGGWAAADVVTGDSPANSDSRDRIATDRHIHCRLFSGRGSVRNSCCSHWCIQRRIRWPLRARLCAT